MSRTLKLNVHVPDEPYEGELEALLFNRGCCPIARAPIEDGRAALEIDDEVSTRGARLFIAPRHEGLERLEDPSIEQLEKLRAFEAPFDPRRELIEIHLPREIVVFWKWCLCLIRGRVVRTGADMPYPLPVCGARVHICEVDPWFLVLKRIDDRFIWRLRDELIDGPVIRPELPPRPEPDPPIIRPRLPERPQIGGLGEELELGDLPRIELPPELKVKLRSPDVLTVRRTLIDHVHLIRPYLCWWPWFHRFLRCDEIAVVETDSQGRFSRLFGYPCPGDKPDLYFWVEVLIDGVWETVYRPFMPCNVYWNYPCGHEVTIRITDPRVIPCGEPQDLPGRQLVVLSIGNGASIDEIPQTGATRGRANGTHAFGGRLEPRVDFSRSTMLATGIRYYRWSYRKVAQPDGSAVADGWHAMTRNVVRHYRHVDPGTGDLSYLPYSLGPHTIGGEAGLMELQPIDPPDPNATEWVVVDAHEDLASAHFETTAVAGASASVQAGYYETKLELFDGAGARVTLRDLANPNAAGSIDVKVPTVAAPFGTGAVPTRTVNHPGSPATWDASLVLIESGDVVGFRLLLQVDNNPCTASIQPISGVTVNACGFGEFPAHANGSPNPANRTVTLAFRASHPNGFGNFTFNVRRGSGGNVISVSGSVTDGTAGIFTRSGITYTGSPQIGSLVTAGCGYKAAFSEALSVDALITNGWSDLNHLDRHDHDAFALAPQDPTP